jgi:HEAT repeat protein
MKLNLATLGLFSTLLINNAQASIENVEVKNLLLQKYLVTYDSNLKLEELKNLTLKNGGQSVEALIEVMKNGKYPDKNRWVATFMLGQIMGDKSAPFLAKFFRHPSWVLRMASLKTMLALKQKNYGAQYAMLLNDESLIVRSQALDNIRKLKIEGQASDVWAMLYDKKNYYRPTINGKEMGHKRADIIKRAIETVGELKFEKAKAPLFKMIQKDKYNDIFNEMDLALTHITGDKSPNSGLKEKRIFWQRKSLDTTIL